VTDLAGEPAYVLDSHHFLRDALFDQPETIQGACWHRPIIVRDVQTRLGDVIGCLRVVPEHPDDDVIDNDLILVWGSQRRIITGSDLLGRLLRGIASLENNKRRRAIRCIMNQEGSSSADSFVIAEFLRQLAGVHSVV
jgi:metal transporter CNNM